MNHYKWLEINLPKIFTQLKLNMKFCDGLIVSDGDKCYTKKELFLNNNIPFEHGVALYLITKISPYSNYVRNTDNGWVDPFKWIVENYPNFQEVFKNL